MRKRHGTRLRERLYQAISVQPVIGGHIVEGTEPDHRAPDAGRAEVNEDLRGAWPLSEHLLDRLGGIKRGRSDHAFSIRHCGDFFFAPAQRGAQAQGGLCLTIQVFGESNQAVRVEDRHGFSSGADQASPFPVAEQAAHGIERRPDHYGQVLPGDARATSAALAAVKR